MPDFRVSGAVLFYRRLKGKGTGMGSLIEELQLRDSCQLSGRFRCCAGVDGLDRLLNAQDRSVLRYCVICSYRVHGGEI